jgi:hypothetical protein
MRWHAAPFPILIATATAMLTYLTNLPAQPERDGSWSSPIELPTHPEQMAVLPSGKVLMWPWAPERRDPPHGPVALWDPADRSFVTFSGSGLESASGLAFQPDGVLLSAGGDQPDGGVDGNARCFAFDFRSESLTEVARMSAGRVFPSATTLADGQILVAAGLNEEKEINATPELWDGKSWTPLPEASNDASQGPVFQFLAPDGRLFRAGPESLTDWLDVETGDWTTVRKKHRNQVRYQGTAVMYEIGKILLTGGCRKHNCKGVPGQSTAEVIDLRSSAPAWRTVSPMTQARHSHHATLLPDGTVLITGGTQESWIYNDEQDGVLQVELWDPVEETFAVVAPMEQPHHFQSTAVLLHDGRVLVAGGAFGPDYSKARFSWTGQIYSPPYLFKGPRPVISEAPAVIHYERTFHIEIPHPTEIAQVRLMCLSAASQGWNGSQRLVPLPFNSNSHGLSIEAPAKATLAPPGYYMLFILNEQGVPSLGHVIRVAPRT